ncbi:MAG: biotin attachment protein [Spirochaetales bacterium]|nr:biotin attachment protein [Spirochaetales bacterium]
MKKRIHTMITAFRDGFQSVYGARVFTADFLPAVEAAVEAGLNHFEAGGGARFQSLYFYCNEDAFEMMDSFRSAAGPEANLQTLARGVNVVGLDSQPRDIIRLHAQLFKKHGITTIRNFDALNDVNNLVFSGQCIVEAGLKHEVCVTTMGLPPGLSGAHTPKFYIQVLRQILDAGIKYDSVCFKDASGTTIPADVYETIRMARKVLGKREHITFHTHETAGASIACYKAALEAGADQIDLSLDPVSGGTCQPDIVSMWHALRGTEYDLGIDIKKVLKAEKVFKECMADYFMPPEAKKVEPLIPFSPMPGGALTANTQMMRDNNTLDKFDTVVEAMEEVVRRGGFGTSVTPVSQFYFQQAFNNVLFGPWERIAEGYGKMVLGYFGKTPLPPDPEIVKIAREKMGLEPTDKLVIDINDADPGKGVNKAVAMLTEAQLPITDENIFIAATCMEKGIAYLQGEAKIGVRKNGGTEGSAAAPAAPSPQPQPAVSAPQAPPAAQAAPTGASTNVTAHLPGSVVRVNASAGQKVNPEDIILVIESMKMELDIPAGTAGTVASILVNPGDAVQSGTVLAVING